MYKETITYTDYNGNERTEDFYFNLSKAEVEKMELYEVGGLQKSLKRMVDQLDVPKIAKFVDQLLMASYGEKSADGRRFIKERNGIKLCDEFKETEAYSVLFDKMITNAEAAAAFFNAIFPVDTTETKKPALTPVNE